MTTTYQYLDLHQVLLQDDGSLFLNVDLRKSTLTTYDALTTRLGIRKPLEFMNT